MKLKIVFSLLSFVFLVACTDIGDRDNINDYNGINYAHGDDWYYLNRDYKCTEDGRLINGKANVQNFYVCDNGLFRSVTEDEIRANLGCTIYTRDEIRILNGKYTFYHKCTENGWTPTTDSYYGSIIDSRDGRKYKVVGIESQLWMAENLNYVDVEKYPSMLNRNWCYDDNPENCTKYGRLYTWSAAIDSVYWKKQGKNCGFNALDCDLPEQVQGICPDGWHLPSAKEWNVLLSAAGKVLRDDSSWNCGILNVDSPFSFFAIPAGYRHPGRYESQYALAYFWSSSMNNEFYSYGVKLNCDDNRINEETNKKFGLSIRCIKDE